METYTPLFRNWKNQTAVTDKIEFELPFFFLGKCMEGHVEKNLKKFLNSGKFKLWITYRINLCMSRHYFPSDKINKQLVNMIEIEKN
jgi:hypothetical protein